MIRDQILGNENVQPNSKEIETLKANFPQFFDQSGQFLQDRFNAMLKSSDVTLSKEGYDLKFLGKSYARFLSSTATETFLAPLEEDNAKHENKDSENLYIIGDNLDALKHLLKSYSEKIKCIYIDPPYNTGTDGFVYSDDFKFDAKDLSKAIGIEEEEATRILSLAGKSSHSAWLTFMYPRLILARDLMSEDGVIFISIDDNEQANLKIACDEIFGEENFVGITSVQSNPKGRSQDMYLAKCNEFLLIYLKSVQPKGRLNIEKTPKELSRDYPLQDNNGQYYREIELRNTHREFGRHNRPNLFYPIFANAHGEVSLTKSNDHSISVLPIWNDQFEGCWTWSKEKSKGEAGLLHARQVSGRFKIYRKDYAIKDGEASTKTLKSLWIDSEYRTEKGQSEFDQLFNTSKRIFDAPKPIGLILQCIRMSHSDLILDFFSGSATAAHAVLQLNAEDGGNRKYILVQLPEKIGEDKPAYQAGYRTIDEIGRERIRRAAKQIQEETGASIDYGFKTFTLEPVSRNTLNKMIDFDPSATFLTEDMISIFDTGYSSGHSSILATWLNEDGYGLTSKAESYLINDFEASIFENTLYIINEGLNSEDVMELIKRLERIELDVSRIVVYPYSVAFSVMHELKKNIKNLRNNKSVEVIERY